MTRGDGKGALDYLRGALQAELPTFVILDLSLETSSGVDVLQELSKEAGSHRIPVVIRIDSQRERQTST